MSSPPNHNFVDLMHYFAVSLQLFFRRNFFLEQKSLKAIDRIVVLLPPLDFVTGNVPLVVVLSVALAAVGLCFGSDRAATVPARSNRLACDFIARNYVVAVDV